MYCDSCGKELSENAKFCRNCGTKTNAQQSIQPAVPPPPVMPLTPASVVTPPPPVQPPPVVTAPLPVRSPAPPPPFEPPPHFEGLCLHCGQQITEGKRYCGKCGKQAGTAPPPKPRKFCQGCGYELGDDLKFCETCGHQVPGVSLRLPAELNAASLDNVKELVSGLNIVKQRLVLMGASLLGIIAIFMPMVSLDSSLNINERRFIENSMNLTWMADAIGWIVLIFLAVPIVLCIMGDRSKPLGKAKIGIAVCGAIIAAIDVIRIIAINGEQYLNPGFGMFLMLIASLGLCIVPFIKQLEK